MQVQGVHMEIDPPKPHTRGYYHEDKQKSSLQFVVCFTELKANG